MRPAAFRRLCVETLKKLELEPFVCPAAFRRLCVETKLRERLPPAYQVQPPSGGCVLKPSMLPRNYFRPNQPPSGGCVLKQKGISSSISMTCQPPSGGCVLKPAMRHSRTNTIWPAAFRRLCVETAWGFVFLRLCCPSRLQAAVC